MLIALALAALITPVDPDGVVTTAPRGMGAVMVGAVAPTSDARPDAALASQVTSQDLTTDQQIERWLSARARDVEPFADDIGPGDDRQMHGFVSGSIGTNDYSSVAVGVSLPIGESGRLDLSYSQTKNGFGYGYGYPGFGDGYPGYGYGHAGSGIVYPGYGAQPRPFGAYDPVYGGRARSGRSIALGFNWDEDKDRRDRGAPRRGGVSAAD